jgi:ubiquinone/menaquinone biosynthesis C-methylase UbiE
MIQTLPTIKSPREIAQQFALAPNSKVADFGSGAGDFSLAVAQLIQPSGKVFAIDVMESAHQSLRSKYKIQGITNIELILTNLETETGSTLPVESMDQVMIHNILFQITNKAQLIQEASRILKPEGTLIVIEWSMSSPIGPSKSIRLPEREVLSLIQNNGFSIDRKLDTGIYHYGYIFTKN